MTDQDLRTLEARVRAQPDDERALAQLGMERLRAGLGWHGEALPSLLVADTAFLGTEPQRGVYRYYVHHEAALGEEAMVEFVYVPRGEVPCDHGGHGTDWACPCKRTGGKIVTPPFYLGRYPVTWQQYLTFCVHANHGYAYPDRARRSEDGSFGRFDSHPAVNLQHADALAFCAWSGLRLPTSDEWRWAALGPPSACPDCVLTTDVLDKPLRTRLRLSRGRLRLEVHVSAEEIEYARFDVLAEKKRDLRERMRREAGSCSSCRDTGSAPRRYPWGNEPPTPERCVWGGHPKHGTGMRVEGNRRGDRRGDPGIRFAHGSTAPVVVRRHECGNTIHEYPASDPVMQCERHDFDSSEWPLVPARPAGASWCGAMDMAGNVWEWTADGEQAGGSFSTGPTELCLVVGGRAGTSAHHLHRGPSSDDVGFRVALSAAPVGASS